MTLNDVRPFGDRLIVRPDAKIGTSDGGLVIPDVVLADNPNYFYITGVVVKLGDGVRDDTCECQNRQCRRVEPRRVNGRCSQCGATQALVSPGERRPFGVEVGDRVLFNRFAGKQIEVERTYQGRLQAELDALDEDGRRESVMQMSTTQKAILNWGDDYGPPSARVGNGREKVLILRETEVLGTVDGDHRVLPGYESPAWALPTSNPGDKRPGLV